MVTWKSKVQLEMLASFFDSFLCASLVFSSLWDCMPFKKIKETFVFCPCELPGVAVPSEFHAKVTPRLL